LKVEHRPKEGGPSRIVFFFGFRAQVLSRSLSAVCEAVSQENGIGRGQIGLHNVDSGSFSLLVPFRQNLDLLEERLVIAALDRL
jgi:hypothetical protein